MNNNNNLPTDDLKKYGIMNEDSSYFKKLSKNDISKFLQGYIMVVDNEQSRVTFKLVDNNSRLEVNALIRDRAINQILEDSKKEIQYSYTTNYQNPQEKTEFSKKAFIYDEKNKQVTEYDMIKDSDELVKIIAERKDAVESSRYKNELLKLKEFLQDKIDKFPEIAKEITNDLNIVSKTINTIDNLTPNEKQSQKQEKSNIQLNVNDPDLYQDANREREEEWEQNQDQERKRGFRR